MVGGWRKPRRRAGLGRMRGLRRQSLSRDGRSARFRQQMHLPVAQISMQARPRPVVDEGGSGHGVRPGRHAAWVSDWLGRRRAGAGTPKAPPNAAPAADKDLRAAQRAEPEPVEDPKDTARREAAAAKRSEDTERAILDALDALEAMDRRSTAHGPFRFCRRRTARCRRIAARLVDGKAAVLAGRIDELPGRLLALRRAIGRAARWSNSASWCCSRAPFAPRRATPRSGAPSRPRKHAEAVLGNPQTLRVKARWEVLAEQVQTRRDGFGVADRHGCSILDEAGPRFAMLLDFSGKRGPPRDGVYTGRAVSRRTRILSVPAAAARLLVARAAAEDAASPEWPTPRWRSRIP